jgi:hypothetical protein
MMSVRPRHARSFLARIAVVCVASGLLFSAGCGKDENTMIGPGPGPGPVYPALTSPQNVLSAMALAYMDLDSAEIKLVYDESYTGTSFDQNDPPAITLTKADEVRHVVPLASLTSITSVSLQLPPSLTRDRDASDPPGWAVIYLPSGAMNLEITDGATSYSIRSQHEFKFIPTTPDSTSPTDTTWKIIRWTEVAN